MEGFKATRITPTKQHAEEILWLACQDLIHCGLSEADALKVVNPNSEKQIESQKEKLKTLQKRYVGVVATNNRLVGYGKMHSWTLRNQMPFCDLEEKVRVSAIVNKFHNLARKPMNDIMGVHELAVGGDNIEERFSIAGVLIEKIIKLAKLREIYIPVCDDDIVTSSLTKRDFVPTGRVATRNDIKMELFVYPKSAANFSYAIDDNDTSVGAVRSKIR